MKNFFQNAGARARQWMIGRYGYDELSSSASVAALVGLLLACIPRLRFLYAPALVLWGWSLFRTCSKNIEKRQKERAAYLRFLGRFRSGLDMKRHAWKERKTHRYYRCKHCHAVLRVPKGKGKIRISCPQCHCETVKKT
jgi:hypothetical protein